MRVVLTVGIAAWLIAAPATAETPLRVAGGASEAKICEMITVTGSRLGTRWICATRAQWQERGRLDREEVEKAQRSPCVIQTTGAGGRASC